jgi:hypothetical protein
MYTLASSDPSDAPILAKLAPGRHSLRGAGGICLDIAKHLSGVPSVIDSTGQTVPESAWRPEILAARKPVA